MNELFEMAEFDRAELEEEMSRNSAFFASVS
jgi:hypothetical protein